MCYSFLKRGVQCFTNIAERYWFYLAFENTICNDYITEKFWRTLDLKTVPIVMGGGNYLRDAPKRVVYSFQLFLKYTHRYIVFENTKSFFYCEDTDWIHRMPK